MLIFVGAERRFTVDGDDIPALARELARLLPGWPFSIGETSGEADIVISHAAGGYVVHTKIAGCDALPAIDLMDAGYQTTSALFLLAASTGPHQFVVHAGAVDVGCGLVAFAGDTHAGKSSLALHLAAAGRRIFGDDRIILSVPPVAPGRRATAMALGLARKVRLPLPQDFAPAAVAYARAHQVGQTVEDVVYLDAAPGEAAPFGERLPISALVLLDRRPDAVMAFEAVGAAETVRRLIGLTMGPHLTTQALLAALALLASTVPVLRLTAPNSCSAATAILTHDFTAVS